MQLLKKKYNANLNETHGSFLLATWCASFTINKLKHQYGTKMELGQERTMKKQNYWQKICQLYSNRTMKLLIMSMPVVCIRALTPWFKCFFVLKAFLLMQSVMSFIGFQTKKDLVIAFLKTITRSWSDLCPLLEQTLDLYRSISFLPHFFKVFERRFHSLLLPTTDISNIIPVDQFGFRAERPFTNSYTE